MGSRNEQKEKSKITLEKYHSDIHADELKNYRLTELYFTDPPLQAVMDHPSDSEQMPVVMKNEIGEVVGFFILQQNIAEKYGYDSKTDLLLRTFSIDEKHRGKGYSVAAFDSIAHFIRREIGDSVRRIILAVNENNPIAIAVYQKAGFVDTGKTAQGIHSLLKIFCKEWM